MKKNTLRRAILPLLLLLQYASLAMGQLSITYPNPRAVFQRNNANIGYLHFGGNFNIKLHQIQARLTPINGGNAIDWTTVAENPSQGTFQANLLATGGWYRLDIRGLRDGVEVATAKLEPVGVGEVFVISGQSNAKGYYNYGQLSAVDDRVNCVSDFYNFEAEKLPYPTFSKLNNYSIISPSGEGSWYWGELGDLLVKKLNVPVLFMNTARDAMGIRSWVNSINGGVGHNPYINTYTAPGYPYNLLRNALQQWVTMLGVRGVLFHQGETDNFQNVSEEEYKNGLSYLINSSRVASGKNLSWVVARVSYDQFRTSWTPVINGQNNIIASVGNVYAGPNTDEIADRADGVHFSSNGLRKVAAAWNEALNDNFFANSTPHFAEAPLQPSTTCNSNSPNPITLSLPENFKSYEWNVGGGRTIETNQGYFSGRAVDFSDKTYFSIPVILSGQLIPPAPQISVNGSTEFCEGKTTELIANTTSDTFWSNGGQGSKITVGQGGVYRAVFVNTFGCQAVSNEIAITVDAAPKPIISSNVPFDACTNELIELKSNFATGNKWSTGQTESMIKPANKQNITLTVTDDKGCVGVSAPVDINLRKPAVVPILTLKGQREFCADTSATLIATSPNSIEWSTGLTGNNLVVKSSGNYFAKSVTPEGCEAKSETLSFLVNPVPSIPTIVADGPTVLCNDKKLTLTASAAERYLWTGGETTKSIEAKTTGNYQVRAVSAKGCISKASNALFVRVLEKPAKPVIEKTGLYTLAISPSKLPLATYEWYEGNQLIDRKTPSIKATTSGTYQVRVKQNYQFGVNETFTCVSDLSNTFNLTIDANGDTYAIYPNPLVENDLFIETLEDVDNTTIRVFDLSGKLMKEFKMNVFDTKKAFDFSSIPPGQYIVEILNNRFKAARRIIRN